MSDLAVLIPVLNRPHRVKPVLESIRETTPDALVVFIPDPDDTAENEAIDEHRDADTLVLPTAGNYATKINVGFDATTEPLLFMGADDLKFWPDWFSRAKTYLVPGIEVVGTQDLSNPRVMRGDHSTHTLFRRSYIEERSGVVDQPRKVLHEGYRHENCDDEFIQTAKARGVYAHGWDVVVEHFHPIVHLPQRMAERGTEPPATDETYELGMRFSNVSRREFRKRRRLWQASPS